MTSEQMYEINRLLDKLDDAVSALSHAEMEVAAAKTKYAQVKTDIRKALIETTVEI